MTRIRISYKRVYLAVRKLGMTTIQKSLLLFHILLLSLLPVRNTSSPTTQAEALIKWKNSLSPSSSLNSWYLTNLKNLCNWTAIVCHTTGTISEIKLSDANLSGTLTQFDFTSFYNLTHLDLNNNTLGGSIPPAIGNLWMLTYLDLGNNQFEGNIPTEIAQLTELQYLSLYNNSLNGTIPYQLSNLQKVWYLDLGANYLVCLDWSNFSGMPFLTHLNLMLNELTSEFPEFITSCQNLTYLDLSQNYLTGPIPELVYTNLGKLTHFHLTNNLFQGPLSSIFPSFPSS